MTHAPLRVLEVLTRAEGFLREHGAASARLDAQLLLAHVLDCDRVRLYVDYEKPLADGERSAYRELIRRRANGEPVAYLIGHREFWSLPLFVDARVLIPRPDSETLVEEAVALFGRQPPERFADVGTGSGCLAAALADCFPNARGLAVDRQAEALAVAAENFAALGQADRLEVRQGHLTEPLDAEAYDLVVANLPYIPSADLDALERDVREHEPLTALDGGPDGLTLIRDLIDSVGSRLSAGGWVLLEVGQGQAAEVVGLCESAGLAEVHTRSDLGGVQRVVAARRVSPGTGDDRD